MPDRSNVRPARQELLHGEVDAVGGRPVDGESAAPDLVDTERVAQGHGQGGGALLPVGGDDQDVRRRARRRGRAREARARK